MELHKQIRKCRLALHLSQEELADQIFVTRQSISNWETDKNYPDIHSLLLMSSLFQISLDELIKVDIDQMKKEIDAKDIQMFHKKGIVYTCLLGIVMISIAPLVYFLEEIGFLCWLVIAVLTGLYSLKIEKFKKDHEIQTFEEILAFSKGQRLDEIRIQQSVETKPYQMMLKVTIAALLGFIITYSMMKLLYSL